MKKWLWLCLLISLPTLLVAQDDAEEDELLGVDETVTALWAPSLEIALRTQAEYVMPKGPIAEADLVALEALKNLKGLRLTDVTLGSLDFLQQHTQLQVLELSACDLTDIAPLAALKDLRVLSLDFNSITDISALATLKELRVLRLYKNQVRDISVLAHMPHLEHLELAENPLRDISVLSGRKSVQLLSLFRCNQIADYSPIGTLRGLNFLNVSFTQPAAVPYVAQLPNLTNLRIQGVVQAGQWRYIRRLPYLRRLTAGANPSLNSLDSLGAYPELRYLDVHSCNLRSLRGIGRYPILARLIANRNQIRDLSPLAACPQLEALHIFGNPLTDISALYGLPALRRVTLPKAIITPELQQAWRARMPACKLSVL